MGRAQKALRKNDAVKDRKNEGCAGNCCVYLWEVSGLTTEH